MFCARAGYVGFPREQEVDSVVHVHSHLQSSWIDADAQYFT